MLKRLINIYGHKFICGMTRSGKTYLAVKMMNDWRGPVIFFNPQFETVPGFFIDADRYSSIKSFGRALRANKKINYVPNADQKQAEKELVSLVAYLACCWKGSNLLFAVDECQDFALQGTASPVLFIARRGLRRNIHGLFIAQRPADVHNVLLSQSSFHIIFQINSYDKKYFNSYRMPGDVIEGLLEKGGPHSFVTWDNKAVSGPYRV